MNLPPHRIALMALILLVLAGAGVWWSRSSSPKAISAASLAQLSSMAPTQASATPMPMPDARSLHPVTAAAFAQCGEAMMGLMRERAGQLAALHDSKSQVAYALTGYLLQGEWSDEASADEAARRLAEQTITSQRAFVRAKKLDPSNPDIDWLAADRCFDGEGCAAVQQALLDSEPDNMAAWLRAMTWAHARGDEAATEAAFRSAASASRYETHRGTSMLAIMEGYAGLPTPEICNDPRVQSVAREQMPGERIFNAGTWVQIIGLAGEQASMIAVSIPREACKVQGGVALAPDRQADCIDIFKKIAGGETLLERSIALPQLIELTGDTPEGIEWRERYRRLRWMAGQDMRGAHSPDLLAMAIDDVAAKEAALRAEGRWPPPANWLPDDERARSLIQTGHPPPPKRH